MTIHDILTDTNADTTRPRIPRFLEAMGVLLPLECSFEHDGVTIRMECVPGDTGGRTFAGIDESSHPDFPFDHPTPCAVLDTYQKEFDRLRSAELPRPVGEALFLQGTNQGDERCERMLQQTINLFNTPSGQIVADGIIGPNTVRAAWKINANDLARAFLAASRSRYREIRSSRTEKFMAGWMNRITAIEQAYGLGNGMPT